MVKTVLVATTEKKTSDAIRKQMEPQTRVSTCSDFISCIDVLQSLSCDLLFVELSILIGSNQTHIKPLIDQILHRQNMLGIVLLTKKEQISSALNGMKAGAFSYVTLPVVSEEIDLVVKRFCETRKLKSELNYLRGKFWDEGSLDLITSRSKVMQSVYEKIRKIAETDTTIYLSGETGTGKGLIAKLIHAHSLRKAQKFFHIHCGAIPDALIESELFGHEKGAFTGADQVKLGKFELAQGGTLFLDEIGTISPSLQIKLLQVLQDKIFFRLGGKQEIPTNVRLITASNANLQKMVESGDFRQDLYYRLNVLPIEIPPLRDRMEDIPFLVSLILKKLNQQMNKDIHAIHPEALALLSHYAFPGNIRELENIIERAYILEENKTLSIVNLPTDILLTRHMETNEISWVPLSLAEYRRIELEKIEKRYLEQVLTTHNGQVKASAENAGLTSRQLYNLMKKHHLLKESFKP